MPIRLKILIACIALTGVTLLMGAFSHRAQRDLGGVATRLYDDAFIAMNYLRAAESKLVKAEASHLPAYAVQPEARAALAAAVADAGADLDVARARAMSPEGEAASAQLAGKLAGLAPRLDAPGDALVLLIDALQDIGRDFETVIEIYAADGFQQRVRAGEIVERTAGQTLWVIAIAVVAALAITALLTRSIVPTMRYAVGVAKAIAAGALDNVIPPQGRARGEAAQLLRSLDAMQTSIRDALGHIRALMDRQASSHAHAAAAQHARFEAALSNMVQGLCLFDQEGRLAVANRRFAEMFGEPAIGAAVETLFGDAALQALRPARAAGPEASRSSTTILPDGRFIAVAHRAIEGGGWVTTYEDVTERAEAEARILHLAKHDALTGLPNRVALREHMQTSWPLGEGEEMAVFCLDLDRFKIVNDTLGHTVGDALLCAVAERLTACTRRTELVVRQGGDEFAIVQRYRGRAEETVALARRIIAALSEVFHVEGHQISISASVGIVLAGEEVPNTEHLIKSADLALYRAKSEGGSTFRFFEASMDEEMRLRRYLEIDLRAALAKKELELFYQPLMNVSTGMVSGFEALIRWRHPERGLVSPALFIPLAEEIGLIKPIGAWVLQQACADASLWPGDVKVAVNLSPVQFRDQSLPGIVTAALRSSGLPASRLELEITESLMLLDDEAVLKILHELRALGARIAMDDFGTGYSSLSYLRRFPFDKIKIDQSFIRGLTDQSDCAAIVRAVISLGQSLSMTVNAEGVETAEQFSALQAQGCGEVQGYLFSKPRPGSEVVGMIRDLQQQQLGSMAGDLT